MQLVVMSVLFYMGYRSQVEWALTFYSVLICCVLHLLYNFVRLLYYFALSKLYNQLTKYVR